MVLSVKDMAALLGCSEQAVYKQVYRQTLPYRKLGRKVISLRQEVEAYLNALPRLELGHINL
jgi:excisionase family DNA binding protein